MLPKRKPKESINGNLKGSPVSLPTCGITLSWFISEYLKRLGWVETTSVTEPSSIQENYSAAPDRIYYRLTKEGIKAEEYLWSNPLFTLYPEIGPSHMKRSD